MKIWKEENKLGGGGYIIYVQIGKRTYNNWWPAPSKYIQHFDYSYLRERYPVITTQKRAEQFSELWVEMWGDDNE